MFDAANSRVLCVCVCVFVCFCTFDLFFVCTKSKRFNSKVLIFEIEPTAISISMHPIAGTNISIMIKIRCAETVRRPIHDLNGRAHELSWLYLDALQIHMLIYLENGCIEMTCSTDTMELMCSFGFRLKLGSFRIRNAHIKKREKWGEKLPPIRGIAHMTSILLCICFCFVQSVATESIRLCNITIVSTAGFFPFLFFIFRAIAFGLFLRKMRFYCAC